MKKGSRTFWPSCFLVVCSLFLFCATLGKCKNVSSATTEDHLEVSATPTTIEAQLENVTSSIGSLPNVATTIENNENNNNNNTESSLPTSTVTSGPNSTSDVTPSEFSTPTTEPHSTTTELTTQGDPVTELVNSTNNESSLIEIKSKGNVSNEVLSGNGTESVLSTTNVPLEVTVNVTEMSKNESNLENATTVVPEIIPQTEANSSGSIDYEITISSSIVSSSESVPEVAANESQYSTEVTTSTLPSESSSQLFTVTLTSLLPEDNVTNSSHAFVNSTDSSVTTDDPENFDRTNATDITNVVVLIENFNSTESTQENKSTTWANNPIMLNPTSNIPSANVTEFVDFDNDTVYSSYDANATTNEVDSTPITTQQPWFLLQFAGNCSLDQEEFGDFEKEVRDQLLARTGVPDQNVSVNIYNCSKSVLVNVSVSVAYERQLSQFFKKLDLANDSKFHINADTYLVTVVGPAGNNAFRQPPEVILSSRHTDIEFVIYVALGSACAFLLVLAVLLVTCKYCRTKPYKGFDVSDVSHLNLRLEDYTLTRIPRPKSIYADYCRSSSRSTDRYCPLDEQSTNQTNGMVHAFDTSVVPLEDVPVADQQTDLQKGNATAKQKSSSSTNDYEDIEGNSVKSTENLHQKKTVPVAPAPWGVDNESFAT